MLGEFRSYGDKTRIIFICCIIYFLWGHATECLTNGGQETSCGSQFSHPILASPGNRTQVVRVGARQLYLLNYLAGSVLFFEKGSHSVPQADLKPLTSAF